MPLPTAFDVPKVLTHVLLVADKREFLRISQAVGMGFLIMGVIGYIVKLSALTPSHLRQRCICLVGNHAGSDSFFLVHIPVNNILVGGA